MNTNWIRFKHLISEMFKNFKSQLKTIVLQKGLIIAVFSAGIWLISPRVEEYVMNFNNELNIEDHKRDSISLDKRFMSMNNILFQRIDSIIGGNSIEKIDSVQYNRLLIDMKAVFTEVWRKAPVYIERYLDEEKSMILAQELRVTDENGNFKYYESWIRLTAEGVKPEIWQKIESSKSLKN